MTLRTPRHSIIRAAPRSWLREMAHMYGLPTFWWESRQRLSARIRQRIPRSTRDTLHDWPVDFWTKCKQAARMICGG